MVDTDDLFTVSSRSTGETNQTDPVVSVCIANYNGLGVVEACIRSILDQEVPFSVEILVHDDASTDNSPAEIQRLFPQVRLLPSQNNVGFCVANNRMVDAARGAYVLLLNNDAALFPDALDTLYRAAVAAGYPQILGLPQYCASTGRLDDRGRVFDPFLNPVPNLDPQCLEVGFVGGACLWLPRTVWYELGGFPEKFQMLAEDAWLCLLGRLRGIPVRVLPASGYWHWIGHTIGGGALHQGGVKTTFRRRRLSERNKTYLMVVTYPWPLLLLILPLHCFLLLVEGVVLAVLNQDRRILKEIYWGAMLDLWRWRHSLWVDRQREQALRIASCVALSKVFRCLPYKLVLLRHGLPRIGD